MAKRQPMTQDRIRMLSHWDRINANPAQHATNAFHPFIPTVSQPKRRRLARSVHR